MKATRCPKCKAALPPKGQFCLDCGFDLYADGLRRRPIPWFHILVIPVVVAGALAVLVIGPCKSETAPEVAVVVEQTKDFVRLLGERDYGRVVERYFKANAARFAEAEELLRQSARGAGAQGLKNAQSQGFRNLEETLAYVRKHGTRNPESVAKLLYAIVSHPEPNPWLSPQRADRYFAWCLEQGFEGADVTQAQVAAGDAGWEGGLLAVKVHYPEAVRPLPGVGDPSVLRWRLVSGGWGGCARRRAVLDFDARHELAELLDLLKRLPTE